MACSGAAGNARWRDALPSERPDPVRREPAIIVVIGAGPRAAGWLERFAVARSSAGSRTLVTIHLVDPFPAGPGRIWRRAQSPLLKLNSMVEDVTMFTDGSCTVEGPIAPGPSLFEWVEGVREGRIRDVALGDPLDPLVRAEVARLRRGDFPTRRLQSHYLDWFLRQTLEALDPGVSVVRHTAVVVTVASGPDAETVRLADGTALRADAVVYAIGHTGSEPSGETQALAAFARRHGLHFQPPAFTADADLSGIRAGETVGVRGMGLAAIDLVVLLTEGRGGRFERHGDGLRYRPSGREPHILIGSRRGIPYRSKISSALAGEPPALRYLTPDVIARLTREPGMLDFRRDVWPLVERELLHGYYRELFTGHPGRTATAWEEFRAELDAVDLRSPDYPALLAAAIPDPADHLDLDAFDRPLAGARFASRDDMQQRLRDHLRDDLHRRTAPEHSATLGLFLALLHTMFALAPVSASPAWTEESRIRDLHGWWPAYFSYVASGPPGHRLEELLALSEAGIVEFAGADLTVEADEAAGEFRLESPSVAGTQPIRTLVDAWLPTAHADRTDNPALRDLAESGAASFRHGMLRVAPDDARVLDAAGRPHPRRWAIGPFTDAPFAGAFARPGTNALSFRENDRAAQAVLRLLEERAASHGATSPGSLRALSLQ
ncbi:FAD/NAD(P)-binding protein [Leifsonia xyli]|uniref:FAD/NAD(P)-binding protein n=1 Tax=Leifsonia xyli TaxID=1575 RepID=UPI003D676F48